MLPLVVACIPSPLQDRVLRSGVNVEPNSDAVAYWNIILGTFMASFDLRAFPFDGQRLHVQMEVPGWAGGNVRLKPSSGGTRMFNTNPGRDCHQYDDLLIICCRSQLGSHMSGRYHMGGFGCVWK